MIAGDCSKPNRATLKVETVRSSFIICFWFVCLFVFGAKAPQWARVSSFTRFLDHTQRRTTVGRTPLDE